MTLPPTTVTPDAAVPDPTSSPATAEERSAPEMPPVPTENLPSDVERLRDFILATRTDLVPELIAGETVTDLLASVETAHAAYRRIRDRADSARSSPGASDAAPAAGAVDRTSSTASPVAPPVPAGGARPFALDPDRLPPSEKIRRGLQRRDMT